MPVLKHITELCRGVFFWLPPWRRVTLFLAKGAAVDTSSRVTPLNPLGVYVGRRQFWITMLVCAGQDGEDVFVQVASCSPASSRGDRWSEL